MIKALAVRILFPLEAVVGRCELHVDVDEVGIVLDDPFEEGHGLFRPARLQSQVGEETPPRDVVGPDGHGALEACLGFGELLR